MVLLRERSRAHKVSSHSGQVMAESSQMELIEALRLWVRALLTGMRPKQQSAVLRLGAFLEPDGKNGVGVLAFVDHYRRPAIAPCPQCHRF